jgi:hypothetical protein
MGVGSAGALTAVNVHKEAGCARMAAGPPDSKHLGSKASNSNWPLFDPLTIAK